MGLAVGRGVGNSVQRHRTARQLRHAFAADWQEWESLGGDFVVRALPAARNASFAKLLSDLRGVRRRLADAS